MKDLGNGLWLNDQGMLRGNHRRKRKLSPGALWAVKRTQELQIEAAVRNRNEVRAAFEFLSALDQQKGTSDDSK